MDGPLHNAQGPFTMDIKQFIEAMLKGKWNVVGS
jgi:hypothetical protein